MIPTQIYGCIHGSVELCCVSVSNNGQEQSGESYLGNVNPIHTLIFNGKSQAATLPGLPAGRWTQCTQIHPDLSR